MAGGGAADAAAALCGWVGALGAVSDEPATDLLALVWGPRFDREHALTLLARLPQADAGWASAVLAFGDRFDALPPACQRALRGEILRLADNAACPASC